MPSRITVIVGVAIFLLGILAGLGAGYLRWHTRGDPFAFRRWVTINRTADFPKGGVLVIGDSTVERQYFTTLCGLPVFNAGLSSSRAADQAPMVADLVRRLEPRVVVFGTGANDVAVPPATPLAELRATLFAMLPKGATVVGISAPEADAANTVLREVAASRDGHFIEPLPANMTEDSVHPNAMGLDEWKRRVNAACR